MNFNEERQLESTYVMGTYARKPVELVRGRGIDVYKRQPFGICERGTCCTISSSRSP